MLLRNQSIPNWCTTEFVSIVATAVYEGRDRGSPMGVREIPKEAVLAYESSGLARH